MDRIDNYHLAVMTAVNELAGRHGLKPYEFSADVRSARDVKEPPIILNFDDPPSGRGGGYSRMISALGLSLDSDPLQLSGTEQHVWDTIQAALARAPRPRTRG